MSIKLMSAIFETEFRDLETGEVENDKPKHAKASSCKIVMLAIADHANDEGESAYPGLTRLEVKTALSRQGLVDVIKALKYNGLLFVSDEPSKLGTNDYTINNACFPKLLDKDDARLLVKPLDQGSQATLLGVVKPLDSNHPLTTKESSLDKKTKNSILAKSGIEWQIAAGVEIKQETIDEAVLEKAALDTFERDMQVASNWEWYPAKGSNERAWKYLREFVVNVYKEDKKAFEKYQTWRTQPYARGAMSNLAIKRRPEDFPSSWTDFLASTMYEKPRRVVSDDERTDLDEDGIPQSYM